MIKIISLLLILTVISCSTTSEPNNNNNGTEPDTTTQNFTFETYEFGDGFESSSFNDVWVFDENNIWAVGYISDAAYGKRNIMIIDENGVGHPKGSQFSSAGIYGIWAQDTSDVFFTTGLVRRYYQGKFLTFNFSGMDFSGGRAIHKLWGSKSDNVWGVGPWGTIVHYNGTNWTQIEFDRQWYFYGITGNKETGIAYAVARNSSFITIIVKLINNKAEIIYQNNEPSAYSIKFYDNENLILSNNKVWLFNLSTRSTQILSQISGGYFLPIQAYYNKNDIYFFGNLIGVGERLLHYNGIRIKDIPFSNRLGVIYGGAAAIDNLSIMVGFSNNKAYLVKIKRVD